MVVVKRRVIPVVPAPTAAPLPTATTAVRRGPIKRSGVGLDALRSSLRQALPPKEEGERNSDGSTYNDTIRRYKARVRNPMTAIRAKCVDCCCGSLKEVAECPCTHCVLHPFRMGVNPLHKRRRERLAGEADGDDDNGEDE